MSTALIVVLIVMILLVLAGTVVTALIAAGRVEKQYPSDERKKFMYASIAMGVLVLMLLVVLFVTIHRYEKSKHSQ